jgi:hypothetical protein
MVAWQIIGRNSPTAAPSHMTQRIVKDTKQNGVFCWQTAGKNTTVSAYFSVWRGI